LLGLNAEAAEFFIRRLVFRKRPVDRVSIRSALGDGMVG
jgi:hypothetical protein